MRKVYGRGLNIGAQLNSTRKNCSFFFELNELSTYKVAKMGAGYMQSYFLLDDGQLLKCGYFFDMLTSIRIFNLHTIMPFIIPFMQKMSFLGKIMSFRGGDETLTLLNGSGIKQGLNFSQVFFGASRIYLLSGGGELFAVGENYFGQLGCEDAIHKEHFTPIFPTPGEKIKQIGVGFQHTVFLTESGKVFGCGRTECYQVQPEYLWKSLENTVIENIITPALIYSELKVLKVACGYKHTLMLTDNNKIVSLGDNRFGQCGISPVEFPEIKKPTMIPFEEEEIIDIACGYFHSLILTKEHLYFFGSNDFNQNPFSRFNQKICFPEIVNLPARPIKMFANFDRNAIICENGKAYLFGGKNLKYCGAESGELEVIDEFIFNEKSEIALGFGHTLIYP